MSHNFHQEISILIFLSFIMRISIIEGIFRVSLQANICSHIEVLQIFQAGLELKGQKVSVDLNPTINLDLQRFDEVSQVNLDPSFLNWGLYFSNFNLNDFQVGYLLIEKIKIRDELSATF